MPESKTQDASHARPHTSHEQSRPSGRRTGSVAAAYLDLRPLPEDVMLDTKALSFDNVGIGAKIWKDEDENKKKIERELPSASSFESALPSSNMLKRPSTAPQFGHFDRTKDNLLGASANARSARYLAIQWRSRATQLHLTQSMSDISKDTAPSPARVSDGSESDSEESVSSQSSEVSAGTFEESIKSQVSDAQKVVEKWQQRWSERSESYSVYSESASRDEEEEEDRDTFGFAMKPSSAGGRNLRPLQPIDSGKEFFSQSQLHLLNEPEENDYNESVDEVKTGVFVMTEGGRVITTVQQNRPVSVDNDDNISNSDSSQNDYDDDQLSESSTVHQSLSRLDDNEHDTRGLSFDISQKSSKEDVKAVIQTFCNVPEPLAHFDTKTNNKYVNPSEEQNSVSNESQPVSEDVVLTPKRNTFKKISQDAHVEQEKIDTIKPSPPITKEPVQYTGSVQDRIEAVKRAKKVAKKKESRPSSSSSSKGKTRRPRSGAKTKHNSESSSSNQPIKWTEHDVIFTFGLLTSIDDAPPTGKYRLEDEEAASFKNKLKTKSRLLYDILANFGEIIRRTKSLGNGSTRYMMCSPDCTPRPINVKRDGKFNCKL